MLVLKIKCALPSFILYDDTHSQLVYFYLWAAVVRDDATRRWFFMLTTFRRSVKRFHSQDTTRQDAKNTYKMKNMKYSGEKYDYTCLDPNLISVLALLGIENRK